MPWDWGLFLAIEIPVIAAVIGILVYVKRKRL